MELVLRALRVLLPCLFVLLASQAARAEDDYSLISLDGIEAPAGDLIYQGAPVDQDHAVSLRKSGVDLSTLEPLPNDVWGRPMPAAPAALPADGAVVDWDSALAGFGHELSVHRVFAGGLAFRLDVSTVPHRALLTRALLARLGYNQYAPKRYSRLTVRFKSVDDRQSFLDAVALDTVKDPKTWVTDLPDGTPALTLRDVLLEPGAVAIQNFYWSLVANDFSQGRRALRATLLPISLCDAPENIDAYRWDDARVFSNQLMLFYPHEIEGQHPFDGVTIDDARWIARRIARLTLADWQAVVAEASYPADIAQIVLQKLLSRRAQVLAALGISAPAIPFDTHLSNASVKDGQVMQATFDGYASRFTYGDAADPLSPAELGSLGVMEGLSSGLATLSGQLNQQMQVLNASQYAQAHAQSVMNDFFRHLQNNPGQPYTQPLSSWGGPIGGFTLNAGRQVTTGTFYGSDAPIQFVDTVSIGANIGYFRALDGIRNVIPSFQANLAVGRTYAHVKPLSKVSDALKVPLGDFMIPAVLHDLSLILANPKALADGSAAEKSQQLKDYSQAVEDFLGKIGNGELFTITDTVAGGPAVSVTVPIQALFPTAPVGYNQGLSFGASLQGMIARRTTFRRVNDPKTGDNFLQVYVQHIDSVTGSLMLDFNYFINILHLQYDKTKAHAHTRVYTVKSDPSRPQETSQTLANSVRTLLRTNSDAALASNYPFYLLNHDVSATDWQIRFLFIQVKDIKEGHRLRVQPPREDDHPFDPKAFERSLYSYRDLHRTGFNYVGLLSNLVGAATHGQGALSGGSGDNPANTPFGSAHWRENYSDAELTPGAKYQPVTISRETWAGWSLPQAKLFQTFDLIDAKVGSLKEFGLNVSPIHREAFNATKSLELYNITTTTVFYAAGVNRIVGALETKDQTGYQPQRGLGNIGADAFTPSDKAVFNTLVAWMGGKPYYDAMCAANNRDNNGGGSGLVANGHVNAAVSHGIEGPPKGTRISAGPNGAGEYWRGNYYECMDPWILEVLRMRRTLPPSSDREGQLVWQTNLFELLLKQLPLANLMVVAQKDGFYFQVQVNGFRKGDHEAKDSENQDVIASYVSDTVGTADTYQGSGAFGNLADKTKITPYEVNAMFLSGGD